VKITFVTNVQPWPENHGGRIDGGRLGSSLYRHGHQWQVIAPDQGGEKPEWVSSSVVQADAELTDQLVAQVRHFEPDLMMLCGPAYAAIGIGLSRQLNIPLVYRSVNREAEMMRIVATGGPKVAPIRPWRERVALLQAALGASRLGKQERAAFAHSIESFDISPFDLQLWKNEGVSNITLLPALASYAPCQNHQNPQRVVDVVAEPEFDVLVTGNLHQLHNLHGVAWFTQRVLPELRRHIDPSRVALAGGCYRESTLRELRRFGVTVIANPEDMSAITRNAAVLVNPIHRTSGATVRTLELVESGRCAVSTSGGVQGYPWVVGLPGFEVEDDPIRFAAACVRLLETGPGIVDVAARDKILCAYHCPTLNHGLTGQWRNRLESLVDGE
jgi:hypothetical protein